MNYPNPLDLAAPLFLLAVLAEVLWRRAQGRAYGWRASSVSLAVYAGTLATRGIGAGLTGGLVWFVWQHRVFTVPLDRAWGWIALFVASEFFYYWFHRFAHECRFMWATHSVHHTPEDLNLLSSGRLGWTHWASLEFVFWLPLYWLGFHPAAVALMLGLNLTYQFWLHTDLIPKLGPLEWVLNTPSHHRVHHARNPRYIDRNYGGVTIVFDRLFGSFAEEDEREPCRYGLVHPPESAGVLSTVFHEWARLGRDLVRARTWRERIHYVFGRPGGHLQAGTDDGAMDRGASPIAQPPVGGW